MLCHMKILPHTAVSVLACCLLSMSIRVQAMDLRSGTLPLNGEVIQQYANEGLQILGLLELGNLVTEDYNIAELSGLAWDEDENILYCVSDKGYLVHLRPVFDGQRLEKVLLLETFVLRNAAGKELSGDYIDSEGLAAINDNNGIRGDTELLVSFERIPRINRYTTRGRYVDTMAIPGFLQRPEHYRNPNTSLESVIFHEHYGTLTAPEKLSGQYPENEFRLFSLAGKLWQFPNAGGKHGSITGLTTTADGKVLVLERIFPNIFTGFGFALHLVEPDAGSEGRRLLVHIGPGRGYINENFEAISHHRDNRFFMISDNNRNALQRTLLLYFTLSALE